MTTLTRSKPAADQLALLKATRDESWRNILKHAEWVAFIQSGAFDRRFYGIYLLETYHYVAHNPRHQALVGTRVEDKVFRYVKFCYEHAAEETGHEMMAMHDLVSLGLDKESVEVASPHSSTEVFIAYLYRVSSHGNPLRRLGYSFWAEDSYQYIGALLDKVRGTLDLAPLNMTFLVSHATIDEKHAQEIDEMLVEFCKTEEDWYDVEEVMQTSLKLQSDILDNVVREYRMLRDGKSSRYSFLNALLG